MRRIDVALDITAWATVDLDTGKLVRIYTYPYNVFTAEGPHWEVDDQLVFRDALPAPVAEAIRIFDDQYKHDAKIEVEW